MKTKNLKFLSILLLIVLYFSSCSMEEEMENIDASEAKNVTIIHSDNTDITLANKDEVINEMRAMSDELYRISSKEAPFSIQSKEFNATTSFSVPPPYYASNSGNVRIRYPNTDTYNSLSFGNRANEHTTQWISLTLRDNINITDFGYPNSVPRGSVTYKLNGVNQSITLNYRINKFPNSLIRSVTITPSSSARLYRNLIVPSPISLAGGGDLHLTVHANEFGWLWLRIKQGGIIRYDQLYRFNYSQTNNNRNGGYVKMRGFDRIGSVIFLSAKHTYTGYCGWFKEK